METVTIRGLRIAYRRQGNGPPLVLLHGAVSDGREWARQMDALSDAFTVVAWDAPGCGASDDPPPGFGMTDYADCLAILIGKLALDRPHVLGLSFGGGLAIALYGRYPAIPRTLVLASAYAGWAGSLPTDEVAVRLRSVVEQSEQPAQQMVKEWLPTLFSDTTPAEVVGYVARIMADFHPQGMRVMARAFAEADLRPVLPHISAPTLLIYGEKDTRAPRKVAEDMQAAIPHASLVFVEGAGHMVSLEAPDLFSDTVRAFCQAHAA